MQELHKIKDLVQNEDAMHIKDNSAW